ncbi:RNA polymerase sigma factor [Pseudodesulfovibrio sediminis]|uniref:RNA polymerase sigma factor n=1 Tax=Pseudodesulfovibrio sediminis TaxID=2810563 RepID=A0ABM7P5J7_9BACT|nr:RNA polymerase sigma factor [Pseudodesulfovibrio sediminis]BCS88198.1 RNA polymerase sigma factor [Pseudodesulfovibrio sediminis]
MRDKRETEIVKDVLLGDTQAFGLLVREYKGPVFNLMLRMVSDGDIAADLSQEAFVKAYEKLDSFKLGKRFFPWLYSIALNVARDWLRSNGRDKHVFMEDASVMVPPGDGQDTHKAIENRLDGGKAFEMVLALPTKYREALMLRYKYEFSMQEIATSLEISVSGAKMRVSRGLDMIRHQFDEGNDD